jgi:hypothetical protein
MSERKRSPKSFEEFDSAQRRFMMQWGLITLTHKRRLALDPKIQAANRPVAIINAINLARDVLQDPTTPTVRPSIRSGVEFINRHDPSLARKISDKIERAAREIEVNENAQPDTSMD